MKKELWNKLLFKYCNREVYSVFDQMKEFAFLIKIFYNETEKGDLL